MEFWATMNRPGRRRAILVRAASRRHIAHKWGPAPPPASRRGLIVRCRDCHHQVEPDPAEMAGRYGIDTTVPNWSKRLVCSQCGSRNADPVMSGPKYDPLSGWRPTIRAQACLSRIAGGGEPWKTRAEQLCVDTRAMRLHKGGGEKVCGVHVATLVKAGGIDLPGSLAEVHTRPSRI